MFKSTDVPHVCVSAGYASLTLTKVQVGLVSLARQLKEDLDEIAATADTSSNAGLQMLLQGRQLQAALTWQSVAAALCVGW